jgi:hypothetical protein
MNRRSGAEALTRCRIRDTNLEFSVAYRLSLRGYHVSRVDRDAVDEKRWMWEELVPSIVRWDAILAIRVGPSLLYSA